jgi:hypothetical protein
MSGYKILGPQDSGKGILIEYDAGYINPNEGRNLDILKESTNTLDHSKPFEFYAVLQKYNTPNRNGRVYPEKILKREADNYKKMIETGTSLSELNHPESSLIDLDRVSHIITEVWWDGPVLLGKLKDIVKGIYVDVLHKNDNFKFYLTKNGNVRPIKVKTEKV